MDIYDNMINSKLEDEKGTETDLAFNSRVAFCMFKAEHLGEKITINDFIEWCDEQIQNGPFILEKKPNKSSVKKWRKRWSHDESAIVYIIKEIKNRLSTADDKYQFDILDLIIEDLEFIRDLYSERKLLKKSDFKNPKDYHLSRKHINETITTTENRIRVRLGLATSYNNNKQEIEGNMNINQAGEENIHKLSDDDLNIILSANDEQDDFLDKL